MEVVRVLFGFVLVYCALCVYVWCGVSVHVRMEDAQERSLRYLPVQYAIIIINNAHTHTRLYFPAHHAVNIIKNARNQYDQHDQQCTQSKFINNARNQYYQ
jgi:hypothetical protein